jgi:hypothetical protein
MTARQLRAMQVSEFCQWLASRTNQEKRPFQQETITAYKVAARALDAWMASQGLEEDFTACDAGVMRLAGWRSRSMLDRYGADMANQRAIEAKRRMGDMY